MVCIRHNQARVYSEGALATSITGLFDTVGIDFIFGMPKTESGHTGIIVMIDYLSKYPFAKPVKGKSAEECAKNLFEYISLFGAPKTIITDQGREFLNRIVKGLLTISGI